MAQNLQGKKKSYKVLEEELIRKLAIENSIIIISLKTEF